jgi:hypothetical protein
MRLNNKEFRRELEACFPTAHISDSMYLLVVYAEAILRLCRTLY